MAKSATVTAPVSASNGAATEANKKQQKSFSLYVDGEGKEHNFPLASAKIVRMKFANGATSDLDVSSLSAEITNCAVLQGITTRLQRSYQGEKEVDKCVEATNETIEDLKNGVWIEPRSGAPRVTILAQALVRVLEAKGETVDDARKASIIEKLKNTEFSEKALANKAVVAAMEDIKFENAKARRDEAKKAAKEAGQEALDF